LRLKNKSAIITGGGSGFGRETSLIFAREGADVAIVDINQAAAKEVAAEVEALGVKALPIFTDISREKQVADMIRMTLEAFGKIDILVNNAGVSGSASIQDINLEQWERTIRINLTGTFLCCREIIDHMIERSYGKIVNVASISGQTGRWVGADYAASKAGVIAITRTLALQVAKFGINVNAVSPATIVTPLLEKNFTPEIVERLKSTIPYRRQGRPQDIANLILFLASDESEWITGEVVIISGGAFMG
jgi:NAD(P)-dependent dehydrogenase (short-subunit alcohol dehydrogenase family)